MRIASQRRIWVWPAALLAAALSYTCGPRLVDQTPSSRKAPTTEWASWRGPGQSGASSAVGLVDSWSPEGENLIWRADFTGRSTPVALNGRIYAIGRIGTGIDEQERIAAFDAESGELVWERLVNVFHSTIPFNRVGWTSLAADSETGYIYAHTISGLFLCLDGDGDEVWSRSLTEEYGRISGYGGRLHTPVVDEDLVIVSYLNSSWGPQTVPRHRYFAFDKRSGQAVWVATPGGRPLDTTYSVPVVAEIDGQRLLIAANADGGVYAMQIRTGKTVWGFMLSKRGLNSSVVVEGDRVYAAHGEENIDNTIMGRLVCIDGTGQGDITTTHEVWRHDGIFAGYSSPVLHQGRLYLVDNSANLHTFNAADGTLLWQHSVGTVGKGSPVWADGKLYVPEVNGGLDILRPNATGVEVLDEDKIAMPDGRLAEIYGSPAVAYGRVYLATEAGLFALGDPQAPFVAAAGGARAKKMVASGSGDPVHLQVVPAEILAQPGQRLNFSVRGFDSMGNPVDADVSWSLAGLKGQLADGHLTLAPDLGQAGTVVVEQGGVQAKARVRVVPPLPWSEDFSSVALDKNPSYWVGAGTKFKAVEQEGERVLVKPRAARGLQRSNVYLGPPDMQGYTIQADMMGTRDKRRRPDMGLIAQRYTLDMMGNHQRLQIRSWSAMLRMAKTIDFTWDTDVWYTVKMKVDIEGEEAVIRGKIWPRDTPEPAEWTITARDPHPNRTGSPGLYGYSPTPVYYDNLKVW
ncbi:MAG: PQQ-binding-like beta-propeller repeat protein [Candidatus Latescibacteria bacterium]|nr:PQQ-binding-like beta-propeller repeat protein [Candidatus Latescibacterota bacterium]